MIKVNTYPEMNAIIKKLLRDSEDNMLLYAAARIEELEQNQLAVRCKDCRFCYGALDVGEGECMYSQVLLTGNDYCSLGKPKEKAEDGEDRSQV